MKLDQSVIDRLVRLLPIPSDQEGARGHTKYILEHLDLVFKPGDSSQSILVENK